MYIPISVLVVVLLAFFWPYLLIMALSVFVYMVHWLGSAGENVKPVALAKKPEALPNRTGVSWAFRLGRRCRALCESVRW